MTGPLGRALGDCIQRIGLQKGYDEIMTSERLEAFSDGVIAIIITITILIIDLPDGNDMAVLMKNMVRKHITFYGWVQGVGFRYRARHAAQLYG
jgi:hypothetical protein